LALEYGPRGKAIYDQCQRKRPPRSGDTSQQRILWGKT